MTVGPIIFSSQKAREFLLSNRFVWTFRVKDRTVGKTWMTDKRGGKKIADVYVSFAGTVEDLEQLDRYVEHSGCEDWSSWLEEIERVNGYLPQRGYVFGVHLL